MNLESLIAELPEQVRYERRELPAEQNALGPWLEASEAIVERERLMNVCSDYELHYYADDQSIDSRPVHLELYRELEKLIAINENALSLIDVGIARERFQLPPVAWPHGSNLDDTPAMSLRGIARFRSVRGSWHATRGDMNRAAADAVAVHRMGSMLCNGEGMVMQYLVGSATRSLGLSAIREITQAVTDQAVRSRLREEIDESFTRPEGLAESLRVECCHYALPAIQSLPTDGPVEKLIEVLLANFFENTPLGNIIPDDPNRVPDDVIEARQRLRRRQLLTLLDGHPRPFDLQKAARRVGEHFAESLANLEAGRPANGRMRRAIAALRDRIGWTRWKGLIPGWPASLSPEVEMDCFGVDEQARLYREQRLGYGQPKWYARSLAPISDRTLQRYAARLRQVENPVGEVVAAKLACHNHNAAWLYRDRLQAARHELESNLAA
jgi:hypothetical protein